MKPISAFKAWIPPFLGPNTLTISKKSAFKPYKPKRIKTNQPAEILRKYAKRLYAVYKSKDIFPYINGKRVELLFSTNENHDVNVSKLSREHLYILLRHAFGKEAFDKNPNWENIWHIFRRKFLKNPKIEQVPIETLFIKNGSNLKVNPALW